MNSLQNKIHNKTFAKQDKLVEMELNNPNEVRQDIIVDGPRGRRCSSGDPLMFSYLPPWLPPPSSTVRRDLLRRVQQWLALPAQRPRVLEQAEHPRDDALVHPVDIA